MFTLPLSSAWSLDAIKCNHEQSCMIWDTWLPVSVDAQTCSTKTNQGSLHASSVNKRPRCLLWQWGHSLHIVSLRAAEKTYCHHSAAQELEPPCGGMLYWKPSQIFVGSRPNGVVVVTGCKCSDFIPRHAECLSLPNKYPLGMTYHPRPENAFPPHLWMRKKQTTSATFCLPPSPCNLRVIVLWNLDIHMGIIIPCIIASSGFSSLKIWKIKLLNASGISI